MKQAYLEAAALATELLADPAVGRSWEAPSVLPKLTVRGLAGHLARSVTRVPSVLDQPVADEEPVALIEHYTRSRWVGADLDDDENVRIRRDGEAEGADGQAELLTQVRDALRHLRELLPAQPAGRVVHLPWAGWSLSLDDYLTTRLVELAVHVDDLAVSVGVPTPVLPPSVLEPVLAVLSRVAVHRHGQVAVLRALSRAERAPGTNTAI